MSRKDESIGKIIDNAIDYIPKRESEVYDPQEGLKDAIRTLKAIYEARLSDYVDTKQESVVFCYGLADYLSNCYPRIEKKERKKRDYTPTPEARENARKNMWVMWAPGGAQWNAQSDDWKEENIKNFDKGGKWASRLELAEIKTAVESYKAGKKTSSRKAPAKK